MRTWLAILLLVVIPLQLTWAATSAYCQHEAGAAAQHLGHHSHLHPKLAKPSSAAPSNSGSVDVDCGTCHAGCTLAVSTVMQTKPLGMRGLHGTTSPHMRTSPPRKTPDRPQWLTRS